MSYFVTLESQMKTTIRKTRTGTIEYKVITYQRSPFILIPMILLYNHPHLLSLLLIIFIFYKRKIQDSVVLIPRVGIVIGNKLIRDFSLPCLNEVQVNWTFRVVLFLHSKKNSSDSCTILFPVISLH